jgi:hypothetical protein
MLGSMSPPVEPKEERRAVPRHMRDGENDLLSDTGVFGMRSTDARGGRGRMILYALLVLGAAGLAAWLGLRP